MKIAVTGANGYLGKNIIQELLNEAVEIIQVQRSLLYGDPQELAKEISGCHAIINLAGVPIIKRWNSKNKALIYNSRVLTTKKNLSKAINSLPKDRQPSVFISASAVGIYRENVPHDEFSTKFDTNFAARVVNDWEDAVLSINDQVRLVIFRQGNVLGKKSQTISKLYPLFRYGLGGKLGSGKQPYPFVHLKDVVKAYTQAIYDDKYVGLKITIEVPQGSMLFRLQYRNTVRSF